VDPVRRRELTRYGAPAAFLLAVTIAVLLIKSGLNGDSRTTTAALPTTTRATTTAPPTTTRIVLTTPTADTTSSTTTTITGAQYYVIQSGDTLGGIASRYGTTVDQLMTLNPGLDPSALQPGQRIRVG